MAGRLNRRQRQAALLALILLLVLACHALLGEGLVALREGWGGGGTSAMPERMKVVFAREMKQSAPAPQPKPAPASRPRPRPAPPPVELAASAPPAQPQEPPPEPVPEQLAAEPPAEAASEAGAAVAANGVEGGDGEPGPEWPESAQLNYRLVGYYRGDVQGEGQVQWIREGSRYQMHLDMNIGPSFAPLIARRMSSEGLLTAKGIAPQRYDEDTRVLLAKRRRATVLFEPQAEGAGTEVQLANGSRLVALRGVQDTASQFVQLTWLFLTGRETLTPGRIVEMPLALPRKLYAWRYQVLGEELLETPIGVLKTWHLRPLLQDGDKLGRDLRAEVWLAPTLQFLPVRLRIEQDQDTFIDLSLSGPPLLRAAAASEPL